MRRRTFLMSMPAGAALAATGRAVADAADPPKPIRDGELVIAAVKAYPTPGRVFVHIDTEAGIDGWGEVNTAPPEIIAPIVEAFAPLLIGMNPTRIEHLWQLMFRGHRNVRGGMLHASAIGGIDIALWDLFGRAVGLPVYTLLGGPCRDKLRYYPSPTAFKQTTHRLHAMVETPAATDGLRGEMLKLREKLGPGGAVMFDGHGKFTATAAIQVCEAIAPAGPLFFEEVVPPENLDDLKRVKAATTVPLAAGERLATMYPFRRVLEAQAVDVVNPDVVRVGGISQLKKVATLAELYDVPIAPHGTHSAVGLAATLHVCAAVNNFLIVEAYRHIVEKVKLARGVAFAEAGHLPLPGGPGLGVSVDRDAVEDAAGRFEPSGIRKGYFRDDGSVADR